MPNRARRLRTEATVDDLLQLEPNADAYSITGTLAGDLEQYSIDPNRVMDVWEGLMAGEVLYATNPPTYAAVVDGGEQRMVYIDGELDTDIPLVSLIVAVLAENGGDFDPLMSAEEFAQLDIPDDPAYQAVLSFAPSGGYPIADSRRARSKKVENSVDVSPFLGYDYSSQDAWAADYGQYVQQYLDWVGVDSAEDLVQLAFITDGDDEGWDLPEGFTADHEEADANTDRFAIGHVVFGTIDGKKVVAEQNSSPWRIVGSKADWPLTARRESFSRKKGEGLLNNGGPYDLDVPEDWRPALRAATHMYLLAADDGEDEAEALQAAAAAFRLSGEDMETMQAWLSSEGALIESRRAAGTSFQSGISSQNRNSATARKEGTRMKNKRTYRAIAEAKVPSLLRRHRGLRMVREDEMEGDEFYVAVAPEGSDDATVTFDGDSMFVGPFDSPDAAIAAVGGGDVDVVDGEGNPADLDAGEIDDDDDLGDMDGMALGDLPMEARRARVRKIRESVMRRIRRQAEALDVDTTVSDTDVGGPDPGDTGGVQTDTDAGEVANGSGSHEDGGAPPVSQQSAQDAGGSTELNTDTTADKVGEPIVALSDPDAGAMDAGDDADLSGAGADKGKVSESRYGVRRGNLVAITERSTGKKVDRGVIAALTEAGVVLEGDESYGYDRYEIRKIA